MKQLWFLVIVMLFSIGCANIPPEERVLHRTASDAVLVLKTPKAGCKNCQKIVEQGLSNEKGVKQSILNLHTKEVSVVYNSKEIDAAVINQKLAGLLEQIPCK